MGKTYEDGMIDMATMFGTVCESKSVCEECSVGVMKGELSCQEFAKKYPKKFASLIKDQFEHGITYADEFNIRFPKNPITAKDLAELGICRRALFEGYLNCDKPSSFCKDCWESLYVEDEDFSEE